ncbi:cyclic nucleotide-gated cation channel beta-1 isoform X2 [Austrofundulus limnaeus]|nr:PREDICTED: cyclic nucleotide-gated cation channel beta-1-like isoform X2 [Austrofundulus limnaeus]XP_013881010.1 PREDICTED: cyclic nucleotide-gated cation channel beta-1-like isoform X2 [Austrofundulus limnaeus]
MLSWVVKVVPHPPEPPSNNTEEEKEEKLAAAPPPAHEKKVTFEDECKHDAAAKAETLKQDAQTAAGNGPVPGVLTWISSALPQPAVPANITTKDEAAAAVSKPEDETGMIAWISQGLEKVVPQLELKSKDLSAAEQQAQVHQTAAPPETQTTVTEVEQTEKSSPPSVIDWIKHGIVKVVPQPEIYPKTDGNNKTEAPAPTKVPPPAPPPATKSTTRTEPVKEADDQPNMMGWIVNGIGRMLPQPVAKLDAGGDEIQNISIVQKKTDLVLEDVTEEEVKMEVKEQSKETQQHSTKEMDTKTQVDQLSPVTDSIKEEAEEEVLAHLEERLQQERLEAARVAEEMARKAAEEAVRQLEVEQSAKILIETLPESNEQLPNILEEENEDDPELQNLQEDSDNGPDSKSPEPPNKDETQESKEKTDDQSLVDIGPPEDKTEHGPERAGPLTPPTLCESAERGSPSSTDAEPGSERRDLESPVTHQPKPQPAADPCTTTEQVKHQEQNPVL